ncbi:MAG TPA: MotA/TolQ/ExbB proton channel family protein, partial [Desulfomicrobiaceae bacterium]|nr:MotA/TolQ/ExbB proton channel family protein [Desulfomicrobiaceae bacterium]
MRTADIVPLIIIAALLVLSPASTVRAVELDASLTSRIQTIKDNRQKTLAIIATERAELTDRHEALLREIADLQRGNNQLRAEFETLLQKEAERRNQLQKQHMEREALREAIRSSARDARELFINIPSTPEFPERITVVERILAPDRFPDFSDTGALLDTLEQAIAHSGTVEPREGVFIGRNGQEQNGTLVRAGEFAALYEDENGDFGFLRPDGTGAHLEAVAGTPGWLAQRSIRRFIKGEGEMVPLDISGGAVLEQMEQQKSYWETIQEGGALIWPILITGLAGMLIGLERIFRLRSRSGSSTNLLPHVLSLLGRQRHAEAADLCRTSSKTPLGRVLGSLLSHAGAGRDILESCLEENLLREASPLEQFLPTLSVLAATAPLLGLLGTVTGMISTFQTITMFGTSDPRMMSGGISEALVTTQLGLAVAIPLVLLHHFLERR